MGTFSLASLVELIPVSGDPVYAVQGSATPCTMELYMLIRKSEGFPPPGDPVDAAQGSATPCAMEFIYT